MARDPIEAAGVHASLAACIAEFLAAKSPRAVNTREAYRRDLEAISSVAASQLGVEPEELEVGDLTVPALQQAFTVWAAEHVGPRADPRPRAASSVDRAWRTWHGLFEWLIRYGVVTRNPVKDVERHTVHDDAPKRIDVPDVEQRLLSACRTPPSGATGPATARMLSRWWPERDTAVMATFLYTAVRLQELIDLNLSHLTGEVPDRLLTVRGKGGKSREIPVDLLLDTAVERYLDSRVARHDDELPKSAPLFVDIDGRRLTRSAVKWLVDSMYRRAGVAADVPEGEHVHALRHTCAVAWLNSGASLPVLQSLLGHASLETTKRYLRSTQAEQRQAVLARHSRDALRHSVD